MRTQSVSPSGPSTAQLPKATESRPSAYSGAEIESAGTQLVSPAGPGAGKSRKGNTAWGDLAPSSRGPIEEAEALNEMTVNVEASRLGNRSSAVSSSSAATGGSWTKIDDEGNPPTRSLQKRKAESSGEPATAKKASGGSSFSQTSRQSTLSQASFARASSFFKKQIAAYTASLPSTGV